MKYFHLLLITLTVFTFSCQQDEFSQNPDNYNTGFDFEIANLMVRAIDVNGEPIANATAYASMNQFTTDANGLAYFPNIRAYPDVFHVKTIAEGYATAFANVKVNRKNCFVEMVLVPHQTQQFQANQAQQITLGTEQAKLELPANAFVDAQGNTYNGTITAQLAYISPTMENFGQAMPGADFMAIDQNGDEQFLVSYGAINAEFFGTNGEELQLAPESPATIELPIPSNATDTPNQIPMWYFDEEESVWIEEGKAILQVDKYIAAVNHFSWHNLDVPVDPKTFVKGQVVDCDNNPLEGVKVKVGPLVTYTNAYGNFQVNIPPNVEFNILINEMYETIYVSGVNQNDIYDVGVLQPLEEFCPLIEVRFSVSDCYDNIIEALYYCENCYTNNIGFTSQTPTSVSIQNNSTAIFHLKYQNIISNQEIEIGFQNIYLDTIKICQDSTDWEIDNPNQFQIEGCNYFNMPSINNNLLIQPILPQNINIQNVLSGGRAIFSIQNDSIDSNTGQLYFSFHDSNFFVGKTYHLYLDNLYGGGFVFISLEDVFVMEDGYVEITFYNGNEVNFSFNGVGKNCITYDCLSQYEDFDNLSFRNHALGPLANGLTPMELEFVNTMDTIFGTACFSLP